MPETSLDWRTFAGSATLPSMCSSDWALFEEVVWFDYCQGWGTEYAGVAVAVAADDVISLAGLALLL